MCYVLLFTFFYIFINCEIKFDEIITLPEELDWSNISPECIHELFNQGLCDSSSQIVAASVLSDRLCIKSNKTLNLNFSPQCKIVFK